jgi:hypothetical protein
MATSSSKHDTDSSSSPPPTKKRKLLQDDNDNKDSKIGNTRKIDCYVREIRDLCGNPDGSPENRVLISLSPDFTFTEWNPKGKATKTAFPDTLKDRIHAFWIQNRTFSTYRKSDCTDGYSRLLAMFGITDERVESLFQDHKGECLEKWGISPATYWKILSRYKDISAERVKNLHKSFLKMLPKLSWGPANAGTGKHTTEFIIHDDFDWLTPDRCVNGKILDKDGHANKDFTPPTVLTSHIKQSFPQYSSQDQLLVIRSIMEEIHRHPQSLRPNQITSIEIMCKTHILEEIQIENPDALEDEIERKYQARQRIPEIQKLDEASLRRALAKALQDEKEKHRLQVPDVLNGAAAALMKAEVEYAAQAEEVEENDNEEVEENDNEEVEEKDNEEEPEEDGEDGDSELFATSYDLSSGPKSPGNGHTSTFNIACAPPAATSVSLQRFLRSRSDQGSAIESGDSSWNGFSATANIQHGESAFSSSEIGLSS